jgi:lipoate-protein ligase A
LTASSPSSSSSSQALFDVEKFRPERRRVLVAPAVDHPTLVLGSTQPAGAVTGSALRSRSVELVRRRGGGGAVYLEPGNHLWLDAWIPRQDPLWSDDVSMAAEWVGRWWRQGLADPAEAGPAGAAGLSIHTGRAVPGRLGELVCFAGRGPGEVFDGDRKVVGLSQWRSREGALFSSCAYLSWDPAPLLDLLELGSGRLGEMAASELPGVAVGLRDLPVPVVDLSLLAARLTSLFPDFGV